MNSLNSGAKQVADQRLVVLATGGTIAGRSNQPGDNVGYTAGAISAGEMLVPIEPYLDRALKVEAEQLARLDSKDMDERTWIALALRLRELVADPTVSGVVVTHGTDTAEETAYWLHRVVPATKPVVLTCSMRPATAIGADGPQNLLDAIAVAGQSQSPGVWLVAAGAIHHPLNVFKWSPYRQDAFSSGDSGLAGWVEEGRVRWNCSWSPGAPLADSSSLPLSPDRPWPRVEVVFSHGGASPAMLESVIQGAKGVTPLSGLVVAGTGNGTIHKAWLPLLLDAQRNGLLVWRTSRCAGGAVVPGSHDEDALHAVGLPPFKARIEMVLQMLMAS